MTIIAASTATLAVHGIPDAVTLIGDRGGVKGLMIGDTVARRSPH